MTKQRAPRKGTIIDLGRRRVYRVAGSEMEADGRIMVRLVRIGTRGPLNMVADLRELPIGR